MAIWEYKFITSGPHGFANPTLLESHLNQLGKDEWEILAFQTLPNNSLAFNGLARRPTVRDWTLEEAAAAAARVEAEKLRAEFAAKFQSATSGQAPTSADDKASSLADTVAPADGLRKLRDTENDNDPEALADEASEDWDGWDEEAEELPTFFEAVKPHFRKNQKGPGMSVGVDYLAKRWEQPEPDLLGALQECGLTIPESEETPADVMEFEGDLYWLNRNNRGQLFLNTREKPRPVFRVAVAKKLDPTDPAAIAMAEEANAVAAAAEARRLKQVEAEREREARRAERDARRAEQAARPTEVPENAPAADAAAAPASIDSAQAPAGDAAPATPGAEAASAVTTPVQADAALLDRIRPMMRRNRRGPGWSGSSSFLARALKTSEPDLIAALVALGLVMPEKPNDKPVNTEIGGYVYWLNKDGRGGVWINGRERREGQGGGGRQNGFEAPPAGGSAEVVAESAPASDVAAPAAPEMPAAPEAPAAEAPVASAPAEPSTSAPVVAVEPALVPPVEPVVTAPVVAAESPAAPAPAVESPSETAPSASAPVADEAVTDESPAEATEVAEGDETEAEAKPAKARRPRAPRRPRKEAAPTEEPPATPPAEPSA